MKRTLPQPSPVPDLDPRHDPGVEAARERTRLAGEPIAWSRNGPRQATLLIGTGSWTDPTMTAAGVFYPPGVSSAEERLRYYASRYPMVEVDSPYYALPARQMVELWMERTPDAFTFDVKANALMTGHPSEVARLPKALRDALPAPLTAKRRIYAKDLPPELNDAVWATFLDALEPLRSSGKLGAVLLQYPRWFLPNAESDEMILEAKARLGDVTGAVELRNAAWFSERRRDRTLAFLAEHDIPFVMVDGPQGLASSVPPIVASTSSRMAVLRLHGRRTDTWERPNVAVAEKYRYLYERDELAAWVPRIEEVATRTREVHIVFNNCYANYGTTNASEMAEMLFGEQPG